MKGAGKEANGEAQTRGSSGRVLTEYLGGISAGMELKVC